jgi:predicted amidohydrolase
MKICALELPARFGDPGRRLAEIDAALAAGLSDDADLVLLPECALTGYISEDLRCDLRPFAEPVLEQPGATLAAYQALARKHRLALGGPLVEIAAGAFFNSFVVVDAQGSLCAHYRKRHPWFPERGWATPGDLPYPSFDLGGLRLALAVCYDVHFLADEAADTLAAADVLLFPSAWVDDGATDLRTALFAELVLRFGLTVVNANWGPGAPRLPGQGRSRIVGPGVVVEAPRRPGGIARIVAELGAKRR